MLNRDEMLQRMKTAPSGFCLTESQYRARIAEGLVMTTARKTRRMKRLHFWLPAEDLEAVRQIAARRGTSISNVVRCALQRELDEENAMVEKTLSFVSIGKSDDPRGSQRHDDLIYGQDPD